MFANLTPAHSFLLMNEEKEPIQQDILFLTKPHSSYQLGNRTPQHYGEGNRRGLISTVLSASLTMALINGLHPPKAPPVRIAIKMIIRRAAAAFKSHTYAYKVMAQGVHFHSHLHSSHHWCKYCDFFNQQFWCQCRRGTQEACSIGKIALASILLFSVDLFAVFNSPM